MAAFEVRIKRSAAKELARLPKAQIQRLLRRIQALGDDPRPPGSQKLSGQEAWRIRQGHYRVIYTIDQQRVIVEVVRVGHRGDIYRD